MMAALRSLRRKLHLAFLGRALCNALRRNDTAREDLNRAIRETLDRRAPWT